MSACFPSGDNYLMFNLNGHPYFGIDEKVKLWEFYADQLEIPELPDIRIMKLEIHGDMAWLACEGLFPIREIGAEGTAAELLEVGESVVHVPFRATEIYHRDDGAGNPVWTMWHFNSSPLPPEDEPRPAFRRHGQRPGTRLEPLGRAGASGRGRGFLRSEPEMPHADVNGTRLFYEVSGEGQPVVQIHGSGFGRGNFATLTPLLSRSFRVIDYDMRGVRRQRRAGAGVLDGAVGRRSCRPARRPRVERAHVHCTSMGGMVAIPFAAKYPDRVHGLVLSCSLAAYDEAARLNKRVWHAISKAYRKGEEFLDLLVFQLFSRHSLSLSGSARPESLSRSWSRPDLA